MFTTCIYVLLADYSKYDVITINEVDENWQELADADGDDDDDEWQHILPRFLF